MKKIAFITLTISLLAITGFSFADPESSPKKEYAITGSVKILNDTDNDIKIHTGSGVVSLNANGGSTSISCNVGTKIYTAPNGSKKDLLFEIDESMCDKTVKLSKYVD